MSEFFEKSGSGCVADKTWCDQFLPIEVKREAIEALHRLRGDLPLDARDRVLPLANCLFATLAFELGLPSRFSPTLIRSLMEGSTAQCHAWLDALVTFPSASMAQGEPWRVMLVEPCH